MPAYPQIIDMTDALADMTPELHAPRRRRHYVRRGYGHHVRLCLMCPFTLVHVFSVIRPFLCLTRTAYIERHIKCFFEF